VFWKNIDSGNILRLPCISAWLPLGRFMCNFIFGLLYQENPNFFKNEHKSGILREGRRRFYCCRQNYIAI